VDVIVDNDGSSVDEGGRPVDGLGGRHAV